MKAIKKYLKKISDGVKTTKFAKAISVFLFVLINLVVITLNLLFWIKAIIFVVLFLCYLIVNSITAEIEKEKLELPKLTRRFTHKEPNGAVRIDEERIREAILYLYEVEDRLYK